MPEGESVQKMFAGIANKYDRANHVLSGCVDYYWRQVLLNKAKIIKPDVVADLATGSGDVAICLKTGLAPDTKVMGFDFCEPMLAEARTKSSRSGLDIPFAFGDCLSLPLEDNSVDLVTISFGFRNLENREKGLEEFLRVLKPGGSLMILEFTQPYSWFAPLYYFYLRNILPRFAKWVTGNSEAYDYLAESIQQFPNRKQLENEINSVGFRNVDSQALTLSIVAIHHGIKLRK